MGSCSTACPSTNLKCITYIYGWNSPLNFDGGVRQGQSLGGGYGWGLWGKGRTNKPFYIDQAILKWCSHHQTSGLEDGNTPLIRGMGNKLNFCSG